MSRLLLRALHCPVGRLDLWTIAREDPRTELVTALTSIMADKHDDDIEQVKIVDNKEIVTVNGEQIVVSSATEQPQRSLWIAWLYIFDVSVRPQDLPWRSTMLTACHIL